MCKCLKISVSTYSYEAKDLPNEIAKCSLSHKACPFDVAVAEATFKIIKMEFIYGTKFDTLEQLQIGFADYINLFNKIRIHCSLGYLTPTEFKNISL